MGKWQIRQKNLLSILESQGFVSIPELAEMLQVSEMTIRRDLKLLEKTAATENGIPATCHPARAIIKNHQEYNILRELRRQDAQKEAIGRFAASLVEPDDIVIFDVGTTSEKIANHLSVDHRLVALCYSVNILIALRQNPSVNMLFAGGRYHSATQMFESEEGIQFIRGIRANKVFLSAAGVHEDMGITCANSYEVATKRAVLRSSVKKILVADSSKFGVVRPAHVCELTDINEVVTDTGLSEEWREKILSQGIQLHISEDI